MISDHEIMNALARATVNERDAIMRDAISKKLGRDDWSLGELQDRVSIIESYGSRAEVSGHRVMLDGLEIAFIKKPTFEQEAEAYRLRTRIHSVTYP